MRIGYCAVSSCINTSSGNQIKGFIKYHFCSGLWYSIFSMGSDRSFHQGDTFICCLWSCSYIRWSIYMADVLPHNLYMLVHKFLIICKIQFANTCLNINSRKPWQRR